MYELLKDFESWALLGHNWPMGFLARRFDTVVGENDIS